MESARSRELDNKMLTEVITEVYDELNETFEVLSSPDSDKGIFKYIGSNPEAQFSLSKLSKKRGVQRPGIGFVIQRSEHRDFFRIMFDLEITQDVIGKDPDTMVEQMKIFAQNQFGVRGPEFVVYMQPAHSGRRGWADKTFVGIEIDVTERDFKSPQKLIKRVIDMSRKLFQTFDFALLENK